MAKDFDSSNEDEMIYIAIKDESDDENDNMDLISHISKNDITMMVGSVIFGNDKPCY